MNNWVRVWKSKGHVGLDKSYLDLTILEKLIMLDGFDSPLGYMSELDWVEYVESCLSRNKINLPDEIFEVGCGAGAFLYPLRNQGFVVSGIDISESLIMNGLKLVPDLNLEVCEALFMPVDKLVDVCLSNHVIHYFPNHNYAAQVIGLMLKKAGRAVLINGVPDVLFKDKSESYRKGLLGDQEYKLKYEGLDLLYFSRDFFEEIALQNGVKVSFFKHNMPGFAQNEFRFDVFFEK
jgi:SAM-dependent methyltransferase